MSDEMRAGGPREPDEVARFLLALRALGDGPAPAPAPAVTALIGGAVPLGSHPYRRVLARAGLAAAALLATLVGAAANHSLPQPAQRVVSNVVNDLTPFDIGPNPKHEAPPVPSQTGEPGRQPARDDGPGDTEGRPGQTGERENASSEPERDDRSAEPELAPSSDGSVDSGALRTSAPESNHDGRSGRDDVTRERLAPADGAHSAGGRFGRE